MKYPGWRYRHVYGYPLRWAAVAELAWRLEHSPLARILPVYRWRKQAERRGSPLLRGER